MRGYYYAIFLIFAVFILPRPVFADNISAGATDEELQKKAEEILHSEPGAEQVKVRVEVEPRDQPIENAISFADFDLNDDGILERDEVGEKLFKIFDSDGNEVIDNLEMKKPSLIVFTPMERKTIEIIDYQDTGKPRKETVTYQEFLHESKLGRFDRDKDGLSPLDFLEMPFNRVNVKDDAVIDLYEWKKAYAESTRPKHMENYNYNG